MKIKSKNQFLTITALLTALAIAIPMVMPLKNCHPPLLLIRWGATSPSFWLCLSRL